MAGPDRDDQTDLRGPRSGTVETVHIPPRARNSKKGATLCVSTQIGCPIACPFCASGKDGVVRNLAAHEILEQYLRGRALGRLSRSVVMGVGEPLLTNAQSLIRRVQRTLRRIEIRVHLVKLTLRLCAQRGESSL